MNPLIDIALNINTDESLTGDDNEHHKTFDFNFFLTKRLLNPFKVSKVLTYLGHEPIAPTWCQMPFTKPFLCYPNIISYTAYIVYTYGFWRVVTTGFITKTLYDFCFLTSRKVIQERVQKPLILKQGLNFKEDVDMDALVREASVTEAFTTITKISLIESITIVITQPFSVIFIRQIAALIDSNPAYETFWGAVMSIFREGGVLAFYRGLTPRLVGEVGCVGLYYLTCMSLGFIHPKVSSKLASAFEFFILSTLNYFVQVPLFYQYELVSTVMAVQNSGLSLAINDSPIGFTNWRECRDFLRITGQSYRGASPMLRCSHIRPNHKYLLNNNLNSPKPI